MVLVGEITDITLEWQTEFSRFDNGVDEPLLVEGEMDLASRSWKGALFEMS